jgi:EXLDI family protein
MNEIKLNRTKKRAVVFMGVEIASCSTKDVGSTRWTKARVYRTNSGNIVVGSARLTLWEGEEDHYDAEVFENVEAAVAYTERKIPEIAAEIARQLGVVERLKIRPKQGTGRFGEAGSSSPR